MDVRVGMKDVHFDVHLKIESVIIINTNMVYCKLIYKTIKYVMVALVSIVCALQIVSCSNDNIAFTISLFINLKSLAPETNFTSVI